MRQVKPTPTIHYVKRKVFIHEELEDCTYIFVRVDRPRRAFKPLYKDHSKLTTDCQTVYTRSIIRDDQINIDRLKPAFLENEKEAQETAAFSNNSNSLLQDPSTEKGRVKAKPKTE